MYDFSDFNNYGYYGYRTASDVTGFFVAYTVVMLALTVFLIICLWRIFSKAGKPGWHSLIPFLNTYDLITIGWRRRKAKTCIVLTILSIVFTIIAFVVIAIGVAAGVSISVGSGLARRSDIFDGLVAGGVAAIIGLIMIIAAGVLGCIAGIYSIIGVVKLGKAFGKGGGFGAGLFFLTPIFLGILAFGKSEYIGNDDFRDQQAYGGGYGGPMPGYQGQPYQQPYGQPVPPQQNFNQQVPPQNFNQQVPPQNFQQPVQPAPQAGGFCSACGKPYQPGTKFCAGCGNQLS
ncbi:MAG: DUF5684 domain-containing protein [Eubacterium sp.]|nr:DUF5684 domain-containing protein [Eubacterium sp.]